MSDFARYYCRDFIIQEIDLIFRNRTTYQDKHVTFKMNHSLQITHEGEVKGSLQLSLEVRKHGGQRLSLLCRSQFLR